jgi:methionyl-tRNA formyltransferase
MAEGQSIKVFLFAGYSGVYGVVSALISENINLVGVLFAPSRIKRLGWTVRIKNLLLFGSLREPLDLLRQKGIPVYFVDDYNGQEAENILRKANPDLLLLYGTKIIKPNILSVPTTGTLNSHSAILPKFRGSRSEFWILYYGEPERAGVTIHWVTPGLDEGDIFIQERLIVDDGDTPRTLREKSRALSGKLFLMAIKSIAEGKLMRISQNINEFTKFRRPKPEDVEAYSTGYPLGRVKKAMGWFLNSGIQNPTGAKDVDGKDVGGGFNAWFNPTSKKFSYIYTEISGYAITTLVYFFKEFKEQIFLDKAKHVGDWLLSIQDVSGAFPTAFYFDNKENKPKEFVTFDIGMVLNGLVNLFRETNEEKYLNSAKKTADWLLKYIKEDGSIAAMVDYEGNAKDYDLTWSTQSGSFHSKIGIGLLNLFDITKEQRYKEAAVGLCNFALTKQKKDGQFLTYGKLLGTNLHPHSYSAEGLFVAGKYLNNEIFFKASQKATEWAVMNTKDGVAPRLKHDDTFNYNERVDILAQVYRLSRIFSLENMETAKLLNKIISYQSTESDNRCYGGFIFGKSSSGEKLPHVNAWVSMFASQAIILSKKSKEVPLFLLI